MSLSDPQSARPPSADTRTIAVGSYRCVCGKSFPVTADSSGSCPDCGRHYSPAALATNFAETMTLDIGGSSPRTATPSSDASHSLIGKSLDHFRIVNLLGQGGMGAVYQAVDESLQRYVAVKVIRIGDNDPSQYARLVREARAQARVNHPHVVHIYYVGLNETSPFFAMELINGRTLAERLRDGPLAFEEVIRFGLQVVSALDRAAQFDIIHGDIKPSNILQVDPQTVKISDFGLSQRLSQTGGMRPLAGTPNYLSPEAARGDVADVRSDMYSLGVTLFELTFGRLPYVFKGATLQENLDVHIQQQPEFPNPWPMDLPEAWQAVLARMLAKDPASRYSNYAELAADLTSLLPKTIVPAARLPRMLAWFLDFGTLFFLLFVSFIPAILIEVFPGTNASSGRAWLANLVGTVLAFGLLAGGVLLQLRWSSSPGKSLFQLKIADQHGLSPRRSVLALRFVFQFLPVCVIPLSSLLSFSLGAPWVDAILVGGAFLWVMASGIAMLLSKQIQSLHDRLLGTRVVVDTQ